jgi:hypothetical protein
MTQKRRYRLFLVGPQLAMKSNRQQASGEPFIRQFGVDTTGFEQFHDLALAPTW